MAAEWVTMAGLLLSGGTLGALTNMAASRHRRDEAKLASEVQRQAHQQTAEDKFRDDLITRVDRLQAALDTQNEKLSAQAVEIAELRGKVQVLEHSESFLKLENARLVVENAALKATNTELNFENEQQMARIAELSGRLAVYEAATSPGAAPGDCP